MRLSKWEQNGPDLFMELHSDPFNKLAENYGNLYGRTFKSFGTTLYDRFRDNTAAWHDEMRRSLLVRYIGFPIWDALIFPLVVVGDLGEIEPITIVRFSPNEANRLSSEGAGGKLVGLGLHHFKAFVDRLGCEKDNTWVGSTAPRASSLCSWTRVAWRWEAMSMLTSSKRSSRKKRISGSPKAARETE